MTEVVDVVYKHYLCVCVVDSSGFLVGKCIHSMPTADVLCFSVQKNVIKICIDVVMFSGAIR